MKKLNRTHVAAAAVLAVGLFFGVSIRLTKTSEGAGVALPELQPVFDVLTAHQNGGIPIIVVPTKSRIVLGGTQEVQAAENAWGFVRQSATWANGNSSLADQIITSLKNSGLLTNSGSWATTTTIGGVQYKVRLQTGSSCCPTISSTAYTGTKSFANRFKLWRASDNVEVLELLFDNINSPNTSNGVLMNYRLNALNASLTDNPNLIVESYIFNGAPNRKQTYSWSGAFQTTATNSNPTSDAGRVVLEEMTLGLKGAGTTPGLCVRIVARTSQTPGSCSGAPFYYALAYGQRTESGFETTAQAGLYPNPLPNGASPNICNFGNILQNGLFNGNGFVTDGVASGSILTGYPDANANNGYPGVTTLFGKLGTTGAGANGYDDLSDAKIDALAPGGGGLAAFRSSNDPP